MWGGQKCGCQGKKVVRHFNYTLKLVFQYFNGHLQSHVKRSDVADIVHRSPPPPPSPPKSVPPKYWGEESLSASTRCLVNAILN